MPGGIMQLIFQGGQDVYLTGNPNMTYFKTVYRRYTQFGTEYITLQYNPLPSFTPTQQTKATCKIDRNADLVFDTYLLYVFFQMDHILSYVVVYQLNHIF